VIVLRIVAGEWRGRKIGAPTDGVRPTGDRVREAWMSIVNREIPGARVLDLFAGSGALGFEALSRGAATADFVDSAPKSLAAIAANAEVLGAGTRAIVHRADAIVFASCLPVAAYDLAFADPPYGHGVATKLAALWMANPFASFLGIEHSQDERLPGSDDRRKYGDTVVTFFRSDLPRPDSAIITADADTSQP
jgi:16S rRNA (guanine966-N2)-methyltransferase